MSQVSSPIRLELQALACMRGDRRLFSDLDLALEAGELLFVKGHNGSGKSTLLRALAGLLLPESGAVLWQGDDIVDLREEYSRHLLYLGHLNGLKDELTGVENLRSAEVFSGNPISEDVAWDTLTRMGLRGHEDVPTKYLSQGQKRRVALARLLVTQSKVWILDEPFSALDVDSVSQLQTVIRQHLSDGGIVILTTHQEVDLLTENIRVLQLGASHD